MDLDKIKTRAALARERYATYPDVDPDWDVTIDLVMADVEDLVEEVRLLQKEVSG